MSAEKRDVTLEVLLGYEAGFAEGYRRGQVRMNARAAQEMIGLGVERIAVEAVMMLPIEDAPEQP